MPIAGYIWWEIPDLHYIDATGAERKLTPSNYQPEGFTYTFDFFFDGAI